MWTGCEAYFDNLDRLPREEVAGEAEPVDERCPPAQTVLYSVPNTRPANRN